MIASKFGIGQQVRHRMLGYLGVVIDVDAEYSLESLMSLNSRPTTLCEPHLVSRGDGR